MIINKILILMLLFPVTALSAQSSDYDSNDGYIGDYDGMPIKKTNNPQSGNTIINNTTNNYYNTPYQTPYYTPWYITPEITPPNTSSGEQTFNNITNGFNKKLPSGQGFNSGLNKGSSIQYPTLKTLPGASTDANSTTFPTLKK